MASKKQVDKAYSVIVGLNALQRAVYEAHGAPIVGLCEVVMPKNQKAYCVAVALGSVGKEPKEFSKLVNLLGVCSKKEGGFVAPLHQLIKDKLPTALPYCEGKHNHALRATRANGDKERKHVADTVAQMRGEFGRDLCKAIGELHDITITQDALYKHLDKWEKANA